jgi:D-alanine-D-alanine ligase
LRGHVKIVARAREFRRNGIAARYAMAKKIRIGVLFGGRSSEHEVSLRSALTVIRAMNPARYEVVPIGVDPDGRWHLAHDAMTMLARKTEHLGALDSGGPEVTLLPHPDSRALVPAHPEKEAPFPDTSIDVIFPVLHGTFGEDGTVQGLLELANIPYVGAGVLGSALGMDKDAQKRLLRADGVPVVRHQAITAAEFRAHPARASKIAREFGYPVFVKPNALGSSVGISKVKRGADLAGALKEAFKYDVKALIEASCSGREFECAVLGNDDPEASVVGEVIVTGGHEFYSYESKYIDPKGSATKIPADIPRAIAAKIRAIAIDAFKRLSLRGMARVDFLARPDLSEIFVNEVNTIPGFTAISMYPKLWEASGMPIGRLIDKLVALALQDHRARAKLKFSYSPNNRPRR